MLYSDPKNNVQNTQLNAAISSTTLSFPMQSGDGALFEDTENGSATSAGSNTVLNSTGIVAKVAVGEVIINLTDKSQAVIKSVTTNSITTEPLFGGADNTWQNGDDWAVGSFEATINTKDVDGNITDYENVYVSYVNGDTLVVNQRGYNGTSAKSWSGTVYVEVFVTNSPLEGLLAFIAQIFLQKANDSEVVHNTGTETIAGAKTVSSFITKSGSLTPTADGHLTTKKYLDDSIADATAGTTGEETAGEALATKKLVFYGQGADVDENVDLYANSSAASFLVYAEQNPTPYQWAYPFTTDSEPLSTTDLSNFKIWQNSTSTNPVTINIELWTNVAGLPGAKVAGTNTVNATRIIPVNTSWQSYDISGISGNLQPNQSYFLVYSITQLESETNIGLFSNTTYSHGNKTYSGGTWQNLQDHSIEIEADIHITTDTDKIYISDKNVSYRNYVHGITLEAIGDGSTGTVLLDGVTDGLGTLVKGGTYNLGTNGAITTAAGGAQVGRGISENRLIFNALD